MRGTRSQSHVFATQNSGFRILQVGRLERYVWRGTFGGIRLDVRLEKYVWRVRLEGTFGGVRYYGQTYSTTAVAHSTLCTSNDPNETGTPNLSISRIQKEKTR